MYALWLGNPDHRYLWKGAMAVRVVRGVARLVLDVESELHAEGVAQQVQTPSKPVTPLFMRVPEFGTVPVPA